MPVEYSDAVRLLRIVLLTAQSRTPASSRSGLVENIHVFRRNRVLATSKPISTAERILGVPVSVLACSNKCAKSMR